MLICAWVQRHRHVVLGRQREVPGRVLDLGDRVVLAERVGVLVVADGAVGRAEDETKFITPSEPFCGDLVALARGKYSVMPHCRG